MKKIMFFLPLILFSIIWLVDCRGKEPKIFIEKSEQDLGLMDVQEIRHFSFPIKNIGNAPLHIERVKVSCGCVHMERTKNVIDPGSIAHIQGTFDSRNYNGEVSRSITISTNDPDNPRTILLLKAKVQKQLDFIPNSISIDLKDKKKKIMQTIKIIHPAEKSFSIIALNSAHNIIDGKIIIENGYNNSIEISIDPQQIPFPKNATRYEVKLYIQIKQDENIIEKYYMFYINLTDD
jgi:hypothetical protein